MTIYDLTLYGVHFPRLIGDTKVILADTPEEVYSKAPKEYRFEVTALEQYGSKKDVLQLKFVDGHTEYITMHEPVMYLEDGEWKPAEHKEVVEEFLTLHASLKEEKSIENITSIFDLVFYGVQEDLGIKFKKVKISLSKVIRDECLTKDSIFFDATILKEYKGNKYVVKAVTDWGEITYIPLFNANMYYDEEKKRWEYCNESPIPGKILKCYVKHLNG